MKKPLFFSILILSLLFSLCLAGCSGEISPSFEPTTPAERASSSAAFPSSASEAPSSEDQKSPSEENTEPEQRSATVLFADGGRVSSGSPMINEPEGLNEYFDYADLTTEASLVSAEVTCEGVLPAADTPLFAYSVQAFGLYDETKDDFDFPEIPYEEMAAWFSDLGLLVVTDYEECNYYHSLHPDSGSSGYWTDLVVAGTEEQVCAVFQYEKPIHGWYFRVMPADPGSLPSVPEQNVPLPRRKLLSAGLEEGQGEPLKIAFSGIYPYAPADEGRQAHQLVSAYDEVYEDGSFTELKVYLPSQDASRYSEPLWAFALKVLNTDTGSIRFSELQKWLEDQGLLVLDGYTACTFYNAKKAQTDDLASAERHEYTDIVIAGTREQVRRIFSEDAPSWNGRYFYVCPALTNLIALRVY